MSAIPISSQADGPWIRGRPVPLDFAGPETPYDAGIGPRLERDGGVAVIEAIARRFPDKVCIDDGKLRLTFAEALDRAYGLAQRLDQETASPVVTALVPNSAISPIIVLACALAGRTLAPIDASHPLDRQTAIFAESGASVVILSATEPVDDSFIPASVRRIR